MSTKSFRSIALLTVVAVCAGSFAVVSQAEASHSWGGYHWARTTNPLTLKLGDNVTRQWDASLALASSDWSTSNVLDTVVVAGGSNPKTCRATAGRVEVCNSKYGNTNWLGIASVWTSGQHITQATVKLNDTYFNTAKYNTSAWRNFVTCQEVGHTFGLGHQDEGFTNANLGTCMDYTNDPSTNQHPNAHDYEMLESIYAHLDTTNTSSTVSPAQSATVQSGDFTNASEWGKSIRTSGDGRKSVYVRDLGNGQQVFTFVVWADPVGEHH